MSSTQPDKLLVLLTLLLVGSVDSRRCCPRVIEGNLEVNYPKINPSDSKVALNSSAWLRNVKITRRLCLHFRAEKEKMSEKMSEEEKQEEVDDSGFYAGKTPLIFSVCATLEAINSHLFCPASRWAGPSGGRDHHHDRWTSQWDQSRCARWGHDREGV